MKTIQIEDKDWKTFTLLRMKYGYSSMYEFMGKVANILRNYKPELELK